MLDLNSSDGISQVSHVDIELDNHVIDREILNEFEEQLEEQYIDLENLGKNIIEDIPIKYKLMLFEPMLEYINLNYTTLINLDQAKSSSNKLIEVGTYTYQFFCVDAFNTIIPHYLNHINCINIEQFDAYFNINLSSNPENFKRNFIKALSSVLSNLTNLSKLDKKVYYDKNYNNLVKRYGYYIELVNFGNSSDFLDNFFRPIIMKHQPDLLWRMM